VISVIYPSSRGGSIVEDFNPYAPPEVGVSSQPMASEEDEGRGVWQDIHGLVMVKIARLPSRCVKCNEPTTYRLKRSLSWHHPAVYLLILTPTYLFAYILVALFIRKTATIEVPLCDQHREDRTRVIRIAWIIALMGLAICCSPIFLGERFIGIIVLGVLIVIAGLLVGLNSAVVTPRKIDDTHIWLNKVCPDYLDQLPWLPDTDEDLRKTKPSAYIDL